ncbi:MAG: hypothetical protein Q8N05_12220 [Bacteroidota bacterium]|nr:hypothetical protein [Bacteroidota bacterium]
MIEFIVVFPQGMLQKTGAPELIDLILKLFTNLIILAAKWEGRFVSGIIQLTSLLTNQILIIGTEIQKITLLINVNFCKLLKPSG